MSEKHNSSERGEQSFEQSQAERHIRMDGMVDSPYSIQSELFGNADSDQIIIAAEKALNKDGFEGISVEEAAVTNTQATAAAPMDIKQMEELLEEPESMTLAAEERMRGELKERKRHREKRAPSIKQIKQERGVDIEAVYRDRMEQKATGWREKRESRVELSRRETMNGDPLADIDEDLRETLFETAEEMADEFRSGVNKGDFMRDVAIQIAYYDTHPATALERVVERYQEEGRMFKRLEDIDPWWSYEDDVDMEKIEEMAEAASMISDDSSSRYAELVRSAEGRIEDEADLDDLDEYDLGSSLSDTDWETIEELAIAHDETGSIIEAVNKVADEDLPEVGCEGWSDLGETELIPERPAVESIGTPEGAPDDEVVVRVRVATLWDPKSPSQFQVGKVAPVDSEGVPDSAVKFTIWANSNPTWDTPDENRLREGDIVEIHGARVNKYNGKATLAADSETVIRVEKRGEGRSPDGRVDVNKHTSRSNIDCTSQSYPHMVVSGTGATLKTGHW